MAKYLVTASYTPEGLQGVLDKGGSARRDLVSKAVADLGGQVESFHFGFGAADAYIVIDAPDNVAVASLAMRVGASGMANVKTIVLLTPEEIDRAAATMVDYQPPGS